MFSVAQTNHFGVRGGVEQFTAALPGEKIIGAQILIDPPSFDPGNRIVTLREVQELRGDITHWQCSSLTWRFFDESVSRMLPFADGTEKWIWRRRWGRRRCFRPVIFPLRNLPIYETELVNFFAVRSGGLSPLHKRLSGPIQWLPVLWTTGDATLTRCASTNWRTREFSPEEISQFIPTPSTIA